MAEVDVDWEQFSDSAKEALAWAAAAERGGGTVGTRGMLIGIMRARGPESEPDQLLQHFGHRREELFDALQQANPSAEIHPEVDEPLTLDHLPRLTANATKALEAAARLQAETAQSAALDTPQLFGGILLTTRGTAWRGLARLGSVPTDRVRDTYPDYLKSAATTRYRDYLRRHFPPPDRVDWISDATAREDLLKRKPLAASLAMRIERIQQETPDASFFVHIDGSWGSGKSTLLNFLQEKLEPGWLVVRYDAWRQARVGPPWWTLIVHLRLALASGMSRRKKASMRTAEAWSRIRVAGAVYALMLVLLLAAALGVFFLLRPADFSAASVGDLARSAAAILTSVGILVGGALAASRFLLWESARGARVYEEIQTNPMETLAEHFAWLIGRANRPVIFFIDDLDRCDDERVVDLLDSIQTLVRDVPESVRRGPSGAVRAPFFVVAAEGAWIRKSYERAHEGLAGAVAEPGRPLGYLFLDKVFQLTVQVPTLSLERQGAYLSALLRSRGKGNGADDLARQRQRLRESSSEAEVVRTLRDSRPEVREALAGDAVEKLAEREVERDIEHDLQRFAPLLERNPRAMKRFVNAYGVERAVRVLEGNLVETGPLALWTILSHRWPDLAEYLRSRPDAIECISASSNPPDDIPDGLRQLLRSPDVIRVAAYEDGGPLTPDLVDACCGSNPRSTAT